MAKKQVISTSEGLKIWRDEHGIPHIEGNTLADVYRGLGHCHALDRGLQILLMRILGRGQASEFLSSDREMLEVDIFFRRMNWTGNMERELSRLSPRANRVLNAYCQGINDQFTKKTPWELRLLGYRPTPWTKEDTLLISRMTGYVTLAQSQGEIELLLLQMVQEGVSLDKLKELFPGLLDELDVDLVKKLNLPHKLVPPEVTWETGAPRMMASNNWVVSGKKTKSGSPILANDPHLETNRLPNVWYEVVMTQGDQFGLGTTMPGLPVLLLGRTTHLSWGATYTFMDAIDSWIEECREEKYRRGDKWIPFRHRQEVIQRKKKPAEIITFYENDHGVLYGEPKEEGHYLATRWSGAQSGAQSLNHMLEMWEVDDVEKGMEHLGQIETAWNWVLADTEGNIGYQMSGLMPIRREGATGFVPLPGWDEKNDWQGFVDWKDLPRQLNPECGYIVTANQDLNQFGEVTPINMPMGPYRAQRITDLLEKKDLLTIADMEALQYDIHSVQADRFMDRIRGLFSSETKHSGLAATLMEWDGKYDPDSEGAWLFESIYEQLFQIAFGEGGMGVEPIRYIEGATCIFADFYHNFDRVLLSEESSWFGEDGWREVYKKAWDQVVENKANYRRSWKNKNNFVLRHMLFGGKLPRFLGFDRGPVSLQGGRATPHQGKVYSSGGRVTSFAPSFRMITDLSEQALYTNMAGGPSDRRFSRWYCSDLQNWLQGKYKTLQP